MLTNDHECVPMCSHLTVPIFGVKTPINVCDMIRANYVAMGVNKFTSDSGKYQLSSEHVSC